MFWFKFSRLFFIKLKKFYFQQQQLKIRNSDWQQTQINYWRSCWTRSQKIKTRHSGLQLHSGIKVCLLLLFPSPTLMTTFVASESGITEDAVRKYLMRKPMTTTELLQKFKSKKTGLSSDQLVNVMTQILKKINPVKQTLKGKMYLSIKS